MSEQEQNDGQGYLVDAGFYLPAAMFDYLSEVAKTLGLVKEPEKPAPWRPYLCVIAYRFSKN